MKLFLQILIAVSLFAPGSTLADRIKDLTEVAGVRSNQLIGYGLVVGLNVLVTVGLYHFTAAL